MDARRPQDVRQKRAIFVKIADDLAAHASIEEKIFYPSVFVDGLEDKRN